MKRYEEKGDLISELDPSPRREKVAEGRMRGSRSLMNPPHPDPLPQGEGINF